MIEATLDRGRTLDQSEHRLRAALDALAPRDRAHQKMLTATALRRAGEIDAALSAHLSLALPEEAGAARASLRLGATELLCLGAPAYAVVDAAVRRTKARAPRFAGLVNAVLRKLSTTPPPPLTAAAAARLNTPRWIRTRLDRDFGAERASAIMAAQLEAPPLDLTPKDADAAEALARRLDGQRLPTGSIRLTDAGAISEIAGYDAGLWWVQDAAAAVPARLFGPQRDGEALDLCAAPGGKTLQLAATGAETIAVDVSESRMRRLRENLARTGLAAELVVADAAEYCAAQTGRFTAILLDAPCSGSGTFRRHPDGPHVKTEEALTSLSAVQDRLLDAAWTALAPGGTLVYAVCSVFAEEGAARIDAFQARRPDAAASPIEDAEAARLGIDSLRDAAGRFQATPADWPDRGGMDGFFAARLVKRD